LLITLLIATNEELGWNPPVFSYENDTRIELTECVGTGRTSFVYSGILPSGIKVAVKHFHEDFSTLCQKEVSFLKEQEQHKLVALPKVCFEDTRYYVMVPLGTKLAVIDNYQADCLVELLVHVHKCGWSHRDIRPSNIVEYNGQILLLDWGFAVKHGKSKNFEGTIHYASNRILQAQSLIYFEYKASDDLYSLVRSVYAFRCHTVRKILNTLHGASINDRAMILKVWKDEEVKYPELWQQTLGACDMMQYDNLKNFLKSLWPG